MCARYHLTILCGGKSMMLAPSSPYNLDLSHAAELLAHHVIRASDEMVEFTHEGIKLTLYRNGNLMFYHYTDIDHGYEICDHILGMLA